MTDLFSASHEKKVMDAAPLAYKARPQCLDDFVGQTHILGKDQMLRKIIDSHHLVSVLFYGPPACGKSTLAQIIARSTDAVFKKINAVSSNVADIRAIITHAENDLTMSHKRTLLFIDEIHRFNKSQQDCLLPAVESGEIILIGATTFNPYFYVIPALLSRMLPFEFKQLTVSEIEHACVNAVKKIYSKDLALEKESFENLIEICSFDIRKILNLIEIAIETKLVSEDPLAFDNTIIEQLIHTTHTQYDRSDSHYEVISAFIKSIRASEPDAALHYLARMIEGGEDIRFIARRLVIAAAEDVGNANPMAIVVAQSVFDGVEKIGMPEAAILLAQATTYLAGSPKSNASHVSLRNAIKDVKKGYIYDIPDYLKNITFDSAEKQEKEGYINPHSFTFHAIPNTSEQYQPYGDKQYYNPTELGAEKKIKDYLQWKKGNEQRSKDTKNR